MRILTIIQARTGSTRLPNKILLDLAGAPLLQRMTERVLQARTPMDVVIATTTGLADDPVEALARGMGVRCFRGHPTDLLDRHVQAALSAPVRPEAVAKIPSDCPLIDPRVIDLIFAFFMEHAGEYDFASNLHPPTWPDGNDVEIMPLPVLEQAWREAAKPHEREHTTPFIWDQPERFRIGNVTWGGGRNLSMSHRWTIDYPEDYQFIRTVYERLWKPSAPPFSVEDILALLDEHPEIHQINARFAGVNWYRNHLDDLRNVSASDTRHPEPKP
ncbi:MAG: 3-deoxy-manno-octulosonate cytidylyltransferase [Myxococcota bacterium]|nr:3-deoxy-manno-octulosonate cytidylyltransferase [Myxococcota bacterium]